MEKKHVLCVATHILGGLTFSRYIKSILESRSDITFDYVSYDSDALKINAPALYRLSDSLQSAYQIKKHLESKSIKLKKYDAIIFLSYHLAVPFKTEIKDKPTLICLDSTPSLAHRGNYQASKSVKTFVKALLAKVLNEINFKVAFKHTDLFLTRTETVKESLVNDYGIDSRICEATYIAIEQPLSNKKIEVADKPKLLFVGNDFKRKGGDFILRVFRNHLRGRAELVLVSSSAKEFVSPSEEDITLFNKIPHDEVLELMQHSDIFLFPTFKDEMGIAICEAVSNALPVIARQTCSQHELVKDGYNGYLMPFDSSEDDWAQKIKSLIESPDLIKEFGAHSQALAEKMFSKHVFENKVNKALDKLLTRN